MAHDIRRSHSRRAVLSSQTMGLGGLAATWLPANDGFAADQVKPRLERRLFDLTPKYPAAKPTARAMISIFTSGGPGQVDLVDPQGELIDDSFHPIVPFLACVVVWNDGAIDALCTACADKLE